MSISQEVKVESKIRIKMGSTEVEYEGSETFLKEELLSLLSELLRLQKENANITGSQFNLPNSGSNISGSQGSIQGTTKTIAAKLACNSGPDLVIAAAAHLTFVAGSHTFSRQNILDEMKTASGHYKKNFSNNLTSYLQNLVKADKLFESAKDAYSLSDTSKRELEAKLAS
jgi:hypothetical protein